MLSSHVGGDRVALMPRHRAGLNEFEQNLMAALGLFTGLAAQGRNSPMRLPGQVFDDIDVGGVRQALHTRVIHSERADECNVGARRVHCGLVAAETG